MNAVIPRVRLIWATKNDTPILECHTSQFWSIIQVNFGVFYSVRPTFWDVFFYIFVKTRPKKWDTFLCVIAQAVV